MPNEFEDFLAEEAERKDLQPQVNIFDISDEETIKFNLRNEIYAQTLLVKALRTHFFEPDGTPKVTTDASDITSYMNSSIKMLSMLREIENGLKTDEDFRRLETAMELAMEDCACPEFVTALETYLLREVV